MAYVKIKLRPFQTPNFVLLEMGPGSREDGFEIPDKIPLARLDAEQLAELCDEFRKAIFKKAGIPDPAGGGK